MNSFLDNFEIRKKKDFTPASSVASSAVVSSIVDTQGFEGVVFFTAIGTANAANYIKVQQSASNAASSMADLAGTKVTAAANGEVVATEVVKPRERYVRAYVAVGAASAVGDIYAVLVNPRKAPVDNNVSSAIVSEVHVSPAEGTA